MRGRGKEGRAERSAVGMQSVGLRRLAGTSHLILDGKIMLAANFWGETRGMERRTGGE